MRLNAETYSPTAIPDGPTTSKIEIEWSCTSELANLNREGSVLYYTSTLTKSFPGTKLDSLLELGRPFSSPFPKTLVLFIVRDRYGSASCDLASYTWTDTQLRRSVLWGRCGQAGLPEIGSQTSEVDLKHYIGGFWAIWKVCVRIHPLDRCNGKAMGWDWFPGRFGEVLHQIWWDIPWS